MKNLFSNPKFLVILIAEVTLALCLILTMAIFKDKEIIMFILGVLAGVISVDTLEKNVG